MSRVTGMANAADAWVERLLERVRLVSWPLAYSLAVGTAAFAATHPSRGSELGRNALPTRDALWILPWCLAGAVAVFAVYVWTLVRGSAARVKEPKEVFATLNARLRFTLALPLVAALGWRAASWDDAGVLAFATLAAVAVALSVYQWPSRATSRARVEDGRLRVAGACAVALLYGGFVWFFGHLAIANYRALDTQTLDLGLYDNLLWHTAHGDPLGTSYLSGGHHGSAHFDPILVAFAPLYLLRPAADSLLMLQVAWVGSTVVPVYLFARHKLGSPLAGVAFAAMYAAHPAVHGATLYEFHSLALASPLLVWLVYFLERAAVRRYWLVLALALLCREDLALLLCFVGAYAMLRGRGSLRVGWITVLVSLVYFTIVKRFFMDSPDLLNSGPSSYGYGYYYAELIPNGNGVAGLALSLLTNPAFVLKNALTEPKLVYVAVLLLPLGLLPLAARPGRVMLVYGLAFCLLATKPAVYSISFQYSCILLPLAFPAAAMALEEVGRWRLVARQLLDPARLRRALLAFALVASALVSWKLGALDPGHPFRAGFTEVKRTLDDADRSRFEWLRAAAGSIPADASVAATRRLGPFVSNRREAYDYSGGNGKYLLVDTLELKVGEAESLRQMVSQGSLVVLDEHGSLTLYRRSP